jgi:hypothetical protein
MDPKHIRKTIDNLLADLRRNPSLGRPQSFMGRYGRPLGLGLALGIGSVAGCGNGSGGTGDALPGAIDIYGAASEVRYVPPDTVDSGTADSSDAFSAQVDTADSATADTRDVLPPSSDAYGIMSDVPDFTRDTADGVTADTRDALPPSIDVYGSSEVFVPSPVDVGDVLSPPVDGSSVDVDNQG